MSDASETPHAASTPRAKQGMPRVSLVVAETYARGVWEAARQGTAPPVSVARAISGKDDALASGGRWRAKVAALRNFHLIEKQEGLMKLSEIGLAVVNGAVAEKQAEGRRRALLSVEPYATVLRQSDGHSLPTAGALAGRFEFDYSLSTEDAKIAAEAFVESAKHAGMLDENGSVVMGGALPTITDTSETEEAVTEEPEEVTHVIVPPATKPAQHEIPALVPETPPQVQALAPGGAGSVEIAVSINMSKWPVDDILTVLNVFGYSADE